MNSLIQNPGLSRIASKIFICLDCKSLANCRLVCHLWFYFINDQMFWWFRALTALKSRTILSDPEWTSVIESVEKDKVKLRQLMTILLNYNSSKSNTDYTILHHVCEQGDLEDVHFLFSYQSLVTLAQEKPKRSQLLPIHYAAKQGHIQVVRWILDKSQEINPSNKEGVSLLHIAALYGEENLIKEILPLLHDLNPKDSNNESVLHYAARGGHYEIFKYLAQFHDDINPGNVYRDGPLHIAASQNVLNGCNEIVRYLLTRYYFEAHI